MSDLENETPAPKIVDDVVPEGDAQAFIPYPDLGEDLENVPMYVRSEAAYYNMRMGFLPNCNKLYLHNPWIAEHLFRLNNALMRDERNQLSEHFKYRLAFLASRDNNCDYCTSHHACTLKRRWGYTDEQLKEVLFMDGAQDEREKVAIEFVHAASEDPEGVTDKLRAKLADLFNPGEVMEIVTVLGFWKMYNTMHAAMALPIEDPALPHKDWVKMKVEEAATGA